MVFCIVFFALAMISCSLSVDMRYSIFFCLEGLAALVHVFCCVFLACFFYTRLLGGRLDEGKVFDDLVVLELCLLLLKLSLI